MLALQTLANDARRVRTERMPDQVNALPIEAPTLQHTVDVASDLLADRSRIHRRLPIAADWANQ